MVVDGVEQDHMHGSGETNAAIGVMTDGFQCFKRGTHDCWPVIGINYSEPPENRYKIDHVLPILLIRGTHHPKHFYSFVSHFVEDSKISAVHGTRIYDAHLEREEIQQFYILLFSEDLPALAMLMRRTWREVSLSCMYYSWGASSNWNNKLLP